MSTTDTTTPEDRFQRLWEEFEPEPGCDDTLEADRQIALVQYNGGRAPNEKWISLHHDLGDACTYAGDDEEWEPQLIVDLATGTRYDPVTLVVAVPLDDDDKATMDAVQALLASLPDDQAEAAARSVLHRIPMCICEDGHVCNFCYERCEDLIGSTVRDSIGREWEVTDASTENDQPRVAGVTADGQRYWDVYDNITVIAGPTEAPA